MLTAGSAADRVGARRVSPSGWRCSPSARRAVPPLLRWACWSPPARYRGPRCLGAAAGRSGARVRGGVARRAHGRFYYRWW